MNMEVLRSPIPIALALMMLLMTTATPCLSHAQVTVDKMRMRAGEEPPPVAIRRPRPAPPAPPKPSIPTRRWSGESEEWSKRADKTARSSFTPVDTSPYFDLPVTYNTRVKWWINYFQTTGRKWFRTWLERSNAYLPQMQKVLAARGMPQDLAYVAMIESGFSSKATSTAEAVGYWQFITPTANRYGLQTTWWLDERRDFTKSTTAASKYLSDLFRQFGSWYLTAAAYNMGEGRTQRLVKRHGTRNYWILSKRPDFPEETRQYIPKLLAAMLIAKAPKLYGFHEMNPKPPYSYDYFTVPGGTDLINLAKYMGINSAELTKLNPELLRGFVPSFVQSHRIRIPQGQQSKVSQFVRAQL